MPGATGVSFLFFFLTTLVLGDRCRLLIGHNLNPQPLYGIVKEGPFSQLATSCPDALHMADADLQGWPECPKSDAHTELLQSVTKISAGLPLDFKAECSVAAKTSVRFYRTLSAKTRATRLKNNTV
jgi:hypothetical protein